MPLALLLVVVFAMALGYLARSGQGQGVPIAPATAAGAFHPLAEDFRPDSTELDECGDDSACLQQAFGNIAYREGARAALSLFQGRILVDPAVRRSCHQIAHLIGSAALSRNGGNVARTFAEGAPTCVSGYYHGILDRAFLGIATKSRLVAAARAVCAGGELRRRGFLDYQCRHGLGHGLMIQTGYDLPQALSVCDGLGTGWDRVACASGTFMENVDTRFGFRSRWLDDEDPTTPCPQVALRFRHSCYLRASWRILRSLDGDFARAGVACSRLGRWAETCYRGLGRDAVEEARDAQSRIAELCRLTGAGRSDCLLGAARTIANASGPRGIEPTVTFCREVPRAYRRPCFSGLGIVIGMLYGTDAKRSAVCARLAREQGQACLAAATHEVDSSGAKSWG